MIAVIQAHKEGKKIQGWGKGSDEWKDIPDPSWNFDICDYRVKPVRVVVYVNFNPSGAGLTHPSRPAADRVASPDRIACVRVEYTPGQFDD